MLMRRVGWLPERMRSRSKLNRLRGRTRTGLRHRATADDPSDKILQKTWLQMLVSSRQFELCAARRNARCRCALADECS